MALHFIHFLQMYDRKFRTCLLDFCKLETDRTLIPSYTTKNNIGKFYASSWLIQIRCQCNRIWVERCGILLFWTSNISTITCIIITILKSSKYMYHSISGFGFGGFSFILAHLSLSLSDHPLSGVHIRLYVY